MTTPQAVSIGIAANAISKKITGQNYSSAGRSVVAAGTGAVMGYSAAAMAVTVAASAAPVVMPLMLGSAVVAFTASLFD